jgi:hypothetical protein
MQRSARREWNNSEANAVLNCLHAAGTAPRNSKTPGNISLLRLQPRAPELNPQENTWQFMRQNWLSNRISKSFDDIVDHCLLRLE